MESALTNQAEINADYVRLWNRDARRHDDIREIFAPQTAVVDPQRIQLVIQDEVDTVLQYQNVVDGQVPNLKGLLEYMGQNGGGGTVNRYTTTYRNNFLTQQSHLHVYQRNLQNVRKQYRKSVEIYAPVLYQKRVQNVKVVRPVYIFAP